MYSLFESSLQKDAFFGCPNLSSANQTVLHCRSPKMKLLQRIHSPNEKWELEFKLLHKSNCYQQLLNAKSWIVLMISACFMQLVASLKCDLSGEDNWTWTSLLLNPFCTPQRSGFKFSTELDLTMCVRNTDQKVSFHCPF